MGNLILTRKAGQSVQVGESIVTIERVYLATIEVSVDDRHGRVRINEDLKSPDGTWVMHVSTISRGHVRLVFTADRSVKIMRTELLPL